MHIEIKGRNVAVTDELRAHIEKRFAKVGKQVSELARLEVTLGEETARPAAERHVAEVALVLKGVTLRAHDASTDLTHSVNLCADELARQVKRHRDKRRARRVARAAARKPGEAPATG
jgi:ribosome hibernation promoting factor